MQNKKTDLSQFNNDWYQPGGSALKRVLWFYVNALFFICPLCPVNAVKIFLLRLFGASVGEGVVIKPSVNIKYPWNLKVGNHVWIGEKVWIDNLAKVTIADNVCISQGALLLTGNHNYKKTSFDLLIGEIILEEGVWIGAKTVVCPKVVCRTHAVLTVGSVATIDLEPYSIYQGNPAVKVKERTIDGVIIE